MGIVTTRRIYTKAGVKRDLITYEASPLTTAYSKTQSYTMSVGPEVRRMHGSLIRHMILAYHEIVDILNSYTESNNHHSDSTINELAIAHNGLPRDVQPSLHCCKGGADTSR